MKWFSKLTDIHILSYVPGRTQRLFFTGVWRGIIQHIQKHFWCHPQKSKVPKVCIAELVMCQHHFKMWSNENHYVQSKCGCDIIYGIMHLTMEKWLLFLKMLTFCCLLLPLITYPQRNQTVKNHWARTGSLSVLTAQWIKEQTDTTHQRLHSSSYQLPWCFISKDYFRITQIYSYMLAIQLYVSQYLLIDSMHLSFWCLQGRGKNKLKTMITFPKPFSRKIPVIMFFSITSKYSLPSYYVFIFLCLMFSNNLDRLPMSLTTFKFRGWQIIIPQ